MIYIITACHNRIETTRKFIDSLKRQSYSKWHLILVDDGSTDGTGEFVKNELRNATVIRGNGNLWWGGALHAAYKWIKAHDLPGNDVVFFTNDDNIYKSTYLEDALQKLKLNKKTLIAGNGFSLQTGEKCDGVSNCDLKTGDITLLDDDSIGNLASTRALMMYVCDLLEIGGFHPVLLPHYLSDYEFTLRAARKGFLMRTYHGLTYTYDRSLTGVKDYKKLTLKVLFSKRCPYNPIYKFNYLLLVTPPKYLCFRISRQIKNYFKQARIWKG